MEVSRELDYQKKSLSHPYYKYSKKTQQSGPSVIQMNTSGGTDIIVQAPQEAINYSKSYVRFKLFIPQSRDGTPDAVVNYYNSIHLANIPFFQTLQFYGDNTSYIVDIPNIDTYNRVVQFTDTDMDTYLSNDIVGFASTDAEVNSLHNGIYRNNRINGVAGNEYARPASANVDAAGVVNNPISPNIAYLEPQYADTSEQSDVGNGGDMYYDYCFPLSMLAPNSFFAIDKDTYFPQIMNIRFVLNSYNKLTWRQVGHNNYNTGANSLFITGGITPQISNFSVNFAIEQDPDIRQGLKNKVMTSGMEIYVPYVNSLKRTLTGTSQSVSYTFKRQHGEFLYKIYHTLTYNQEQFNNAYNMNNGCGDLGVPTQLNQKAIVYYTLLNSNVRLQDNNIVSVDLDDWFYMKEKLKGSVLGQSADLYHYNWCHVDHFSGESALINDKRKYNEQLISGLSLAEDKIWDFVGVQTNDVPFNHYTFAITLRKLVINSTGYMMM